MAPMKRQTLGWGRGGQVLKVVDVEVNERARWINKHFEK